MPQPISIDSLYTQKSPFSDRLQAVPQYKDPAGTGNYYHLLLTVRDSSSQDIYLHSDEIIDGNTVIEPLFSGIEFKAGDSIKVALQCVDHGVFTYYSTLQQTMDQNSATPANPQSNITGGALGYFSAHTEMVKKLIVQ